MIKNFNPTIQEKLGMAATQILEKTNPKTWLERLTLWADEYDDKRPAIQARMYRKLIDGVANGENGDKLLKNIIDEEMNLKLAERIKQSDRQYAVNQQTKQRIYSDDGGATWHDEKTGSVIK